MNVLNYVSLPPLLVDLKKVVNQAELAKKIGISPQNLNQVLHSRQHLVYEYASKWRKALKLPRTEGDYFELLALIHAFRSVSANKQGAMLKRAMHLAGRLEEQLNSTRNLSSSLIYWLDPLLSILRNLVELSDCPKESGDMAAWAMERLAFSGWRPNTKAALLQRIETAWQWLLDTQAVRFNRKLGRWEKSNPNVLSEAEIGSNGAETGAIVLLLNQLVTYQQFADAAGSSQILGDKLAVFSLPSKALPLLEAISREFIFDNVLKKLNFLVNRDDLERLKNSDINYYKQVVAWGEELKARGYSIPAAEDVDVDTTVQMLLATMKVTR